MDDDIDSIHRPVEALPVAYIANKQVQAWELIDREVLAEMKLFQLIPAVDDQSLRLVFPEDSTDEALAKRTGPSGYQDTCAVQTHRIISFVAPRNLLFQMKPACSI